MALANRYQLFTLRKDSQLVGAAGIHVYPHLTDTKRAWVHDLIVVSDRAAFEYQSLLIAHLRDRCFRDGCAELAIHVPIDDAIENQFFQQGIGQPFAFVYEWTSASWRSVHDRTSPMREPQYREIRTSKDIASGLALLTHFHSELTEASLAHAMENGYQIFGLWIDDQISSIATLIHYPHLKNKMCVWLQDGMVLPKRTYKEAASSLFHNVMNACFQSETLTVTVHARVRNRRIHQFYEAAGGHHTANAYKWKIRG
ncbi:MAG: GNAT family N-acetyltransferase [Leptolyngbyaceae cyanobacterium SM1_3_5]|nr:GNAT family N-acetyltransferase [Leptolyngbyaceae cyanobacterium SM1_3_5]